MQILFTLDPSTVIHLVLSLILPLFVALVTKRVTSSSAKAWLLAGLTLVTSVITGLSVAITNHVAFDLGVALLMAIPQFVVSVGLHFGLWKPTGVSTALQNVGAQE